MTPRTQPVSHTPLQDVLARVPAGTPFMAELQKQASFAPTLAPVAFPPNPDGIAALFEQWRQGGGAAPMDVILGLAPVEADAACLIAAAMASLPSTLKFHNHHHTREVVFLSMLLARDLPQAAQREIFIAACIHDFGHDGKGNRRGAVHAPMRLERRALELAQPYLFAAGVDAALWQRIAVMVLATDVSKDNASATSPAEWLRRAVLGKPGDGCPPELAPLFADASLALSAAILEDADLGTSAGMNYDHASRMTALIADETGVLAPTPQTLIGFLDHICHGAFVTRQALETFGDNIPALRARADDETADTIYNWS